MKKSFESFLSANRRAFFVFGVVLCLGVFGFVAWQTKAQEDPKAGSPSGSQKKTGGIKSDDKTQTELIKNDAYVIELPEKFERDSLPPGPYLESPAGQGYLGEVEPNGTTATASPLAGTNLVARGNLFPNGDIDHYSFTATAGDRVYAAVMTSFSAGSSTDSQLTLIASDGTTVIEFDDDNGSFAGLSSSIAGAVIPSSGTYFLKVNDFTAGTTSERGYELHLRLQSAAPTVETEPNDTPATANPLPANGHVSGARNPAVATEQDWYSFTANAGDTVYLSLDVDPEDDLVVWNGRLGIGLFGDATNQILVVDDSGTGDVLPNPNRPSEALFFTVKTAGTYFAFVDSATAATGGPTATYNLSVSIHPATNEGVNCTTYTSTNVPQTIPAAGGLVSSTITVPGNPRIADLDVEIQLNHTLMADIDAHLRSPAGNDNGLFTDIGAAATGGQSQMDVIFDDEAGVTPAFTALRGMSYKPENNSTGGTASTSGAYRLSWFDGENAGGTWTLDLRDDTNNASGGTLTGWSLRVCEQPPPPACAPGFAPQTVFTTDFEAGAAGFTHSGAGDEWELGLPATIATTTTNPVAGFSTCNSGVNCWKTDLDNTYNASSSQDLLSPNINLAGLQPPVVVTWSQRHQIEAANFDHMFVDAQQVGGATPIRLYEWLEPTPISASAGTGNPQVNIGGSVGWGRYSARADSLAGLNSELRFHLDSDTTVQFGGLAIDDVSVTACRGQSADLVITKTDGVATAVPGGSVTYTITAANAGPDDVTGATVADTFPAILTATWTCVGAGGGICTAAGAGNINDTVNLPVGASVTYTVSATISASATGTLSNTATVSSTVTDPVPGNNSATDTDTLTPQADLAITKTDGVVNAVPGGSVTYTITASNAGPSNAPSSTVADTFPASLTATWTCVGAGGGTCTAAGAGNINDTVNLPVGASVTYTVSATISASATGNLVNTATVSSTVTDPVPGNNSATDTDTLTPTADLSLSKAVNNATPNVGSNVTFTLTLNNAGPSNATGVTVQDLLPAGLTYVSDTGGGAYNSGTGVWTVGTVNSGASPTLQITATATTLGAKVNYTQVTASSAADPDSTPNNNSNNEDDDDSVTVTPQAVGGCQLLYGYNFTGDRLVTFSPATPGTLISDIALTGLTNEDLLGIDFRPSNGNLMAVASNFTNERVVTVNTTTGAVTNAGGTVSSSTGLFFGLDFNPVVDRIRLVDDADNSRRLNPNDGTLAGTDTALAYVAGDPGAGSNPSVVHVAYDRSVAGATLTTLYGIDIARDALVRIGGVDGTPSPNTGQLTTIGPLGVDATSFGGFDIPPGGTGTGYAALRINGVSQLYSINLTTGAATLIGAIGAGTTIDGLAVGQGGTCTANLAITKTDGLTTVNPGQTITYTIVASNAGPAGVNGAIVTDNFVPAIATPAPTWTCVGAGGGSCPANGVGNINALVNLPPGGTATFTVTATVSPTATFGFTNTATITPPAGATDPVSGNNTARDTDAICPATNPVIFGYNFTGDRLVRFNANTPGTLTLDIPLTGLAANEDMVGIDFRPANGSLMGVASNFTDDRVVTINTTTGAVTSVGGTLPTGTSTFYGLDFNPVSDRIRFVDDGENSRRLNPNDGTLAGTDTALAYVAGDPGAGSDPAVVHVAYTNSVNPAPATTTLFGIDAARDVLVRIGGVDGNPSPNTGQLTTIGPLGVQASFGGFDIEPGTNNAYAVLRVAAVYNLYRINLTTGAATLVGAVGAGTTIDGIAIVPATGGCTPTAAGVTVSGRVTTPDGYGLRNARVTVTDASGVSRSVTTSSFGYYSFEDLEVGGTYVFSVTSRRYTFIPRTVTVNDALSDIDFVGQY